MVVRWIKTGPTEFVANWQGVSLLLEWLPQEHRWGMQADARRVRQRWASPAAAMECVELTIGRLLARLDPAPIARQRAPRPLRLVAVVSRLMQDVRVDKLEHGREDTKEHQLAKVLTGLLHEVDPNVDPSHIAHLPAEGEEFTQEITDEDVREALNGTID